MARSVGLGALGVAAVVATAGACTDLFHDTDWPTRCGADPCASGGGGGFVSTGTEHHASSGSHAGGGTAAGGGGAGEGAGPGAGGFAPTCTDGAKNGDETDTDCGGSCSPCGDGSTCVDGSDCAIGVCSDGVCACGGPHELCCTGGSCAGTVSCAADGRCRLLALPNAIGCGSGCRTPDEFCQAAGFAGAEAAAAFWLGQCGGPGECPTGWNELVCGDWCIGGNCVGNNYCGPAYVLVTDAPGPTTALCATDHGGNCVSDNPGYYVRVRCL